ncbi:MAG: serine--tRNA ligase [Patescibacteria group bacterium]|nr:serine--tRNA ligase [Patescibacteria group bacterium]
MLDIKYIREHKEEVKKNCENRLSSANVDELLKLDEQRRKIIGEIDSLRTERNQGSKGKPSPEEIEAMKQKRVRIGEMEAELAKIEEKYNEELFKVPNLTHPDVKASKNEDDNPVLEIFKEPAKFDFEPKDHVQLSEALDLIDFNRAAEVSGAKFYYLKNELALLEFALIQYALEILYQKGFTPITTPDLAKQEVLKAMGFNPRGESTQIYNIENSDLSLIGTAEITMGGYHRGEVLSEAELPKKYAAVSHCFRTEAGSYSKFSKGIFRVHQFTKIEMFQYVRPETSEAAHRELLEIEKEIFKGLDIPFRVVDHCTADLGAPSTRTFDLEAWMPGKPNKEGKMGDWGEITSTSNCTDYQARALNIKYKKADGDKEYVHMLNGTAIAVTRAIIAILENYQQADGSIKIPEVLVKYMPGRITSIKK